jgi:hypothetical protein
MHEAPCVEDLIAAGCQLTSGLARQSELIKEMISLIDTSNFLQLTDMSTAR